MLVARVHVSFLKDLKQLICRDFGAESFRRYKKLFSFAHRSDCDDAIEMMNVHVYEYSEEPRQYLPTQWYEGLREWHV